MDPQAREGMPVIVRHIQRLSLRTRDYKTFLSFLKSSPPDEFFNELCPSVIRSILDCKSPTTTMTKMIQALYPIFVESTFGLQDPFTCAILETVENTNHKYYQSSQIIDPLTKIPHFPLHDKNLKAFARAGPIPKFVSLLTPNTVRQIQSIVFLIYPYLPISEISDFTAAVLMLGVDTDFSQLLQMGAPNDQVEITRAKLAIQKFMNGDTASISEIKQILVTTHNQPQICQLVQKEHFMSPNLQNENILADLISITKILAINNTITQEDLKLLWLNFSKNEEMLNQFFHSFLSIYFGLEEIGKEWFWDIAIHGEFLPPTLHFLESIAELTDPKLRLKAFDAISKWYSKTKQYESEVTQCLYALIPEDPDLCFSLQTLCLEKEFSVPLMKAALKVPSEKNARECFLAVLQNGNPIFLSVLPNLIRRLHGLISNDEFLLLESMAKREQNKTVLDLFIHEFPEDFIGKQQALALFRHYSRIPCIDPHLVIMFFQKLNLVDEQIGIDELWECALGNEEYHPEIIKLFHSKPKVFIEKCAANFLISLPLLFSYIKKVEDPIDKASLGIQSNKFECDLVEMPLSGNVDGTLLVPRGMSITALEQRIASHLRINASKILVTKRKNSYDVVLSSFQREKKALQSADQLPSTLLIPYFPQLFEILHGRDENSILAYEILNKMPTNEEELETLEIEQTIRYSIDQPYLMLYRFNIVARMLETSSDFAEEISHSKKGHELFDFIFSTGYKLYTKEEHLLLLVEIARELLGVKQYFKPHTVEIALQWTIDEESELIEHSLSRLIKKIPSELLKDAPNFPALIRKLLFDHSAGKRRAAVEYLHLVDIDLLQFLEEGVNKPCAEFFTLLSNFPLKPTFYSSILSVLFTKFSPPQNSSLLDELTFQMPTSTFTNGIIHILRLLVSKYESKDSASILSFLINRFLFNPYKKVTISADLFSILSMLLQKHPEMLEEMIPRWSSKAFKQKMEICCDIKWRGIKDRHHWNAPIQLLFHLHEYRNSILEHQSLGQETYQGIFLRLLFMPTKAIDTEPFCFLNLEPAVFLKRAMTHVPSLSGRILTQENQSQIFNFVDVEVTEKNLEKNLAKNPIRIVEAPILIFFSLSQNCTFPLNMNLSTMTIEKTDLWYDLAGFIYYKDENFVTIAEEENEWWSFEDENAVEFDILKKEKIESVLVLVYRQHNNDFVEGQIDPNLTQIAANDVRSALWKDANENPILKDFLIHIVDTSENSVFLFHFLLRALVVEVIEKAKIDILRRLKTMISTKEIALDFVHEKKNHTTFLLKERSRSVRQLYGEVFVHSLLLSENFHTYFRWLRNHLSKLQKYKFDEFALPFLEIYQHSNKKKWSAHFMDILTNFKNRKLSRIFNLVQVLGQVDTFDFDLMKVHSEIGKNIKPLFDFVQPFIDSNFAAFWNTFDKLTTTPNVSAGYWCLAAAAGKGKKFSSVTDTAKEPFLLFLEALAKFARFIDLTDYLYSNSTDWILNLVMSSDAQIAEAFCSVLKVSVRPSELIEVFWTFLKIPILIPTRYDSFFDLLLWAINETNDPHYIIENSHNLFLALATFSLENPKTTALQFLGDAIGPIGSRLFFQTPRRFKQFITFFWPMSFSSDKGRRAGQALISLVAPDFAPSFLRSHTFKKITKYCFEPQLWHLIREFTTRSNSNSIASVLWTSTSIRNNLDIPSFLEASTFLLNEFPSTSKVASKSILLTILLDQPILSIEQLSTLTQFVKSLIQTSHHKASKLPVDQFKRLFEVALMETTDSRVTNETMKLMTAVFIASRGMEEMIEKQIGESLLSQLSDECQSIESILLIIEIGKLKGRTDIAIDELAYLSNDSVYRYQLIDPLSTFLVDNWKTFGFEKRRKIVSIINRLVMKGDVEMIEGGCKELVISVCKEDERVKIDIVQKIEAEMEKEVLKVIVARNPQEILPVLWNIKMRLRFIFAVLKEAPSHFSIGIHLTGAQQTLLADICERQKEVQLKDCAALINELTNRIFP